MTSAKSGNDTEKGTEKEKGGEGEGGGQSARELEGVRNRPTATLLARGGDEVKRADDDVITRSENGAW